MKIVFIALQLSQPRCIKRIKAVYDAGFDIKVYGFDSGLYNDSLKSLPFPVERIYKRNKSLSKFQKIKTLSAVVRQIIKENKNDGLFYLFGFEIAGIAWFLGCDNYVYEEADVTASREKRPWLKQSLISLDKRIIKRAKLTVFTSQGFTDYLFKEKCPKNIIQQPNKLNRDFFDEHIKKMVKPHDIDICHLRFGFVGLIRYPNTIIRFAKVIGRHYPQYEFHFYGTLDRKEYWDLELDSYSNVYNHGPFKNPIDQPNIYSEFDISVVCYDTTSDNVRIAEPNKLYESIFFETPIVVSSDTFLEKRVKELGVGFSLDASNDDKIIKFIDKLNLADLIGKREKMKQIPISELVDNTDNLINELKIIQKISNEEMTVQKITPPRTHRIRVNGYSGCALEERRVAA